MAQMTASAKHVHQHGPNCGHLQIEHGGHVDYLHDGHLCHQEKGGAVVEHSIAVSGAESRYLYARAQVRKA